MQGEKMATVVLSPVLTPFVENKDKLEVQGKTLFAVLINLIQDYPLLRTLLFDVRGELAKNMNFYLNAETVRNKYWQNIPIKHDDVINILQTGKEKINSM